MQPGLAVGGVVLARDDARQRVDQAAAVAAAADLVAAVRARQAARVGARAAGWLVVFGEEGGGFAWRGCVDYGGGCARVEVVGGGCMCVMVVVVVVVVMLAAGGATAGVDGVVVGALAY